MSDDVWEMIAAERRVTQELVASWDDSTLAADSWCDGWRVRDVAGHLAWVALTPAPEVVREVLLAGGRPHRAMAAQAKVYGGLDTDVLVDKLRLAVDSRLTVPTVPLVSLLADLVVHHQDMCRPLGVELVPDPVHLDAALGQYLSVNAFTGGRKRSRGLRLVATDRDWSHGEGPEVRGPAVSLLLAAVGRAGALADLEGNGVATLTKRC